MSKEYSLPTQETIDGFVCFQFTKHLNMRIDKNIVLT